MPVLFGDAPVLAGLSAPVRPRQSGPVSGTGACVYLEPKTRTLVPDLATAHTANKEGSFTQITTLTQGPLIVLVNQMYVQQLLSKQPSPFPVWRIYHTAYT